MGVQTFIQAIANSFSKPAPTPDGNITTGQALRGEKYAELATVQYGRGMQYLSDEGSYFVATNPTPGTAITATAALTSYATTDTQPTAIVKNNNAIGSGVNIYLDFFKLQLVGLPAGATALRANWVWDNLANHYTSGGSTIVPVNPNMNSASASNMVLYFGALSAATSSVNARIISNDQMRGTVAATPVALLGDEYIFRFGAVEQAVANYSLNVAAGTPTQVIKNIIDVPPLIIGPQQVASLRIWGPNTGSTTTCTYEFVMGYWER